MGARATNTNIKRRAKISRGDHTPDLAAALSILTIVTVLFSPPGAHGQVEGLICPSSSVFAQPPNLGDPEWETYISDLTPYFIRYEKFQGLNGSICGVRWWGFNVFDAGTGFIECVEAPMSFLITLYQDASGQPGDEVYSYLIDTAGTAVAEVNGWSLYLYETSLDSCCVLTNGWISVVGTGGDPSCWFMWNSSWAGDGSACQQTAGGLVCGTGRHFRDLSLCLTDSPVQVRTTTWGSIKSLYQND